MLIYNETLKEQSDFHPVIGKIRLFNEYDVTVASEQLKYGALKNMIAVFVHPQAYEL